MATTTVKISEDNLKHGVLALVLALVEIVRDALKHQAYRRMESGSLTGEQVERLGQALLELDRAIEEIQEQQGAGEAVRSVREGLDSVVDDLITLMLDPDQRRR
ncbi:MAG: gas vesicle protein K [Bacillota bacterium]|nr:gas vesicle protein K [Bacillota bacterium]